MKVYETVKGASFRTHIFQSIWMSSILGHAEYRVHKPLPNGIYGVESTIKKGFGVPLLLHLQPKNYNQRAAIPRNLVLIRFSRKHFVFWTVLQSTDFTPEKYLFLNMAVLFKLWASLQAKQNFNEELILDKAMNLSWETKREKVDMVNWLFPKQIWWKMVGF